MSKILQGIIRIAAKIDEKLTDWILYFTKEFDIMIDVENFGFLENRAFAAFLQYLGKDFSFEYN